MSSIQFRRPARQQAPAMPRGEVLLESPPEIPEAQPGKAWMRILMILPMLAGAGAMALFFGASGGASGGRNTLRLVASGLFGVSMLGLFITQFGRQGNEKAQEIDGERCDYFRYLTQVRRRVRKAAGLQRDAVTWHFPASSSLWTVATGRRLWERRVGEDEFLSVRVATGPQQLAVRLVPPQSKPVEDLEPLTAGALRRFVRTHQVVQSMPVALSLRSFRTVRATGELESARSLVRAAVAHLATFHSPEDLRVIAYVTADRRGDWDWLKWLPHAMHPARADAAGPIRLIASSPEELAAVTEGLVGAEEPTSTVVVCDGLGLPALELAADSAAVTWLEVVAADRLRRAPDATTALLEVSADRLSLLRRAPDGSPLRQELGVPEQMSVPSATTLARSIAPFRLLPTTALTVGDGDDSLPAALTHEDFPALIGSGDPYALDPAEAWRPRAPHNQLRVPFGVDPEGRPVELDIKESAQGGMGPHGLVIGATGSGKSEFLRTLVLGLVMTHSSEMLNLVLIDFKGGATFLGLDDLPHVSAVITNLEDELPLVDRMKDALHGEMVRRQEHLRRAGNYASRRDYEAAREGGAALDPMPSLFIVVDEFTELLSVKPEFIDLFVMIGRLGRSLGVHLLLASQRLEEGKLRGLDTHLSYRVALRTFSASESRVVIGVADAYQLPSSPGNGYLKYDTTDLVRFKAAYVSGPYRASAASRSDSAGSGQGRDRVATVVPYTSSVVEPTPAEIAEAQRSDAAARRRVDAEAAAAAEREGETGTAEPLLDLVVARLRGHGRPAHQVWLPPLDESPTVADLLPPLETTLDRGLGIVEPAFQGRLRAPMAIVDRPFDQQRSPMWVDLAGAAGHLAVIGQPQTGKSTVARSLIASLALTHTPQELQFYCVDFGGGTLGPLAGLPHVGGVATRLDPDLVRRTVAEMTSLLAQRETAFAEHGIDSIASYRRARRAGTVPADRFAPDVVLVVDGWLIMRQEFEALEDSISKLASRGLGFGIHVVGTANKWSDLRLAIRDLFQSRVELKIGEAFESEIDRKAAVNVPKDRPGRGLSPDALHMLGALPRIDGVRSADDLTEGVKSMVASVAEAWQGPTAPPVRRLPESLPYERLVASWQGAATALPFAIDEDELAPVGLDFSAEPHFVAMGANECGKSNLLRVILRGLVEQNTPQQARMIIVDYRRSLLGAVEGEHLVGYAASSDAAAKSMKDVAGAMKNRLPGPDVTQDQLRARNWWSGPDLYVVVDDYELVASSSGNPLTPLVEVLPQAQDIGLHVILARGMGGAGRAMFEPVIQRIREGASPALVMSGTKEEGNLFGEIRPRPLPVGRGTLVTRRAPSRLVQVAHLPEEQ